MTGYSHRLLSFWQGNVESNLRILRINNFFWGWAMTRNCRSCAYMYWILVVSLVRTSLSQGLGRGLKACCRAFGCVASIIHSFIHPSIHHCCCDYQSISVIVIMMMIISIIVQIMNISICNSYLFVIYRYFHSYYSLVIKRGKRKSRMYRWFSFKHQHFFRGFPQVLS